MPLETGERDVYSRAHAEITEEIAPEPLNGRNNMRIEVGGIVATTEVNGFF